MVVFVSSSFCVALPSLQVLQFSLPTQDSCVDATSPESIERKKERKKERTKKRKMKSISPVEWVKKKRRARSASE